MWKGGFGIFPSALFFVGVFFASVAPTVPFFSAFRRSENLVFFLGGFVGAGDDDGALVTWRSLAVILPVEVGVVGEVC